MHSKTSTGKKTHNSKHKSKKSSKSGGSPVPEKEKSYKSYTGFSAKSIRCMWEQHECSNETEINPDAVEKVAEDATYKVWELASMVKTYANKSNGRVTVDLVNEALKDSNVEPIFGASFNFWDRIECDGTVFFNYDEQIDLQEEYTKEVVVEDTGPLHLAAGWYGEPNRQQELIELYGNIVDGVYFGNTLQIRQILMIVGTNPYTALICKLLLSKCIEMLAFEYTDQILLRTLKLLNAISQNPLTQSGQYSEEHSYLSQIFEGLLLGGIKEFKYELGTHFPVKMEMQHIDEEALISTFPAIQQVQEELIGNLKSEADYPHFNEIKKECEDLFIMMDTHELTSDMKREEHNEQALHALDDFYQHQQEPDDVSVKISDISSEPEQPVKDERLKMVTMHCNLRYLDELCFALGNCAAHWGHVEQEVTFYLTKRLEDFFKCFTCWTDEDFEFIYRITSALWTLGEFTFREMLPYFERIDTQTAPDYFIQIFNRAAIYIRGRNDIFFYEWLADLCGNYLIPFLIFYANSVQKYNLKHKRRHDARKNSDSSFKIFPKVNLRQTQKSVRFNLHNCETTFENFKPILKSDKKKFSFRFSGCRPVNSRGRKGKLVPTVVEPIVVQAPLEKFHSKVVIAKRKLLRPVTNIKTPKYCANYHLLVI